MGFVGSGFQQQINLWDLTTDHDFTGASRFSLTQSMPVFGGRRYAVWVWAGGDAESSGLSYGSLNVNLYNVFAHLA